MSVDVPLCDVTVVQPSPLRVEAVRRMQTNLYAEMQGAREREVAAGAMAVAALQEVVGAEEEHAAAWGRVAAAGAKGAADRRAVDEAQRSCRMSLEELNTCTDEFTAARGVETAAVADWDAAQFVATAARTAHDDGAVMATVAATEAARREHRRSAQECC